MPDNSNKKSKPLRIAAIGNYVPRQCGIATFTRDLVESITLNKNSSGLKAEAYVFAMNDQNRSYAYPDVVKGTIQEESRRDYLKAAKYINFSNADVCILQHEFGIFGGESGRYILYLVQKLEKPLVATFHTVLKNPSPTEKIIIQEISRKAEYVVVMSNRAVTFLRETYQIPDEKIKLILHGVPDLKVKQIGRFKQMLHLENRKSLFTFGLLSRNKGIETVIDALPPLVKKYPEVIYIILGRTHPNVVAESGEEYRSSLRRRIEKLNIRENVYFDNRFVSNEELFAYLATVDIYITPYLNEAQITSGTLSYAIGAGTAVISTPYWHAEEILSQGRGRLFNFGDSQALSKILLDLFEHPEQLTEMRKKAYQFGRKTTWPEIGHQYLELASTLKQKPLIKEIKEQLIINPLALPVLNLSHINRLTDSTGIFQHARYIIPNLKDGYCLDDNARALLMAAMVYNQSKNKDAAALIPVYLGFINYMQKHDGTFHNFLGFDRDFKDKTGSEDSFGRAVWALGFFIRNAINAEYREVARLIFEKSIPVFPKISSPRGIANTAVGICHYLFAFPRDDLRTMLKNLVFSLIEQYNNTRTDSWRWYEPVLAYDNGILPYSLFHAYQILEQKPILKTAVESMEFLENVTMKEGMVFPVGSDGWYPQGKSKANYAQQPLDILAMVLMFYQAFVVLRDDKYLTKLINSFMWFLGDNELGIPVYDFETKGCRDGLEQFGVNLNQGAESTLAYIISKQVVLCAHDREASNRKNADY